MSNGAGSDIPDLGGLFPDDPGSMAGGGGDYSPYPSGVPSYGSGCGEEKLCECLGDKLSVIAQEIHVTHLVLQEMLGGECKQIAGCIDKIIEEIDKRYKGIRNTCEQCEAMAEQGLAGTLEYALTCANCIKQECDTICSFGDTDTEGKCCATCGKDPCCCVSGECVPCGEETTPKKKYVGWCSFVDGLVSVTKEGEPSPGPTYTPVAFNDTEQAALDEAQAKCETDEIYHVRQDIIPPFVGSALGTCTGVIDYLSGSAGSAIAGANKGTAAIQSLMALTKSVRGLGFDGINVGNFADIARALGSMLVGSDPSIAQEFVPYAATLIGCGGKQFEESAKILAAVGLADKTAGTNLSQFATPYLYAMHASCRQLHLDPDKAMAAYLANSLTTKELDAHWAIAGLCPEDVQAYAYAAKSKPIPLQLAFMRRRELISASEYAMGMRQLGYIDPPVPEMLFKLTEQVPTLSDIIHLMVRDADDDSPSGPVVKFNLDVLFNEKYGKQLRKWAEWQGITEDVARFNWRAHWTIPSPTQLFEFYHRLRTNPKYPNILEDVKTALVQQDILPYWHEHFLAVSFRPMGRVDIRRSYNLGTLTDDELVPAYVQLGYSDDTADKLAKFSKRLRDESAVSHKAIKLWLKFAIDRNEAASRMIDGGLPDSVVQKALNDAESGFISSPYAGSFARGDISRDALIGALVDNGVSGFGAGKIADLLALKRSHHPILKSFIAGSASRQDSLDTMVRDGTNYDVASRVLDDAEYTIEQHQIIQCQRGIKRRYLTGDLDKDQSLSALTSYGTVLERANRMVSWWQCELSSHGKSVSANKLCEWLARGVISSAEFIKRLVTIGYTNQDANIMLDDCLISISAKRTAQAKKEAKEQSAADQRAAKLIQQANAAAERDLAAVDRANKQRAATKARREKQLLSAASKMADKCDCTLYDSLQYVNAYYSHAKDEYALSVDEALQTVLQAVEAWEGGNPDSLLEVVDQFAQTIVDANLIGAN